MPQATIKLKQNFPPSFSSPCQTPLTVQLVKEYTDKEQALHFPGPPRQIHVCAVLEEGQWFWVHGVTPSCLGGKWLLSGCWQDLSKRCCLMLKQDTDSQLSLLGFSKHGKAGCLLQMQKTRGRHKLCRHQEALPFPAERSQS